MTKEKNMMRRLFSCTLCLLSLVLLSSVSPVFSADRPNILFCISDDQSWPHASAYGFKAVNTPAFDRIAREGILFNNAFAPLLAAVRPAPPC